MSNYINILSNQAKRYSFFFAEEMELAENVLRIEESDRCKICHKKKADVVFNPCGHLAACSECATTARRCTLCKEKIQECIKVYRA